MTEPVAVDAQADATPYWRNTPGVSMPGSLSVALVVLLAVLVGGYFVVGLDRMDASQLAPEFQVDAGSPAAG